MHTVGVCVSSIQEGVGLSQSTVSDYLATLQRAGLVEARRIGQWTYYKRNEANISAFAKLIGKSSEFLPVNIGKSRYPFCRN